MGIVWNGTEADIRLFANLTFWRFRKRGQELQADQPIPHDVQDMYAMYASLHARGFSAAHG